MTPHVTWTKHHAVIRQSFRHIWLHVQLPCSVHYMSFSHGQNMRVVRTNTACVALACPKMVTVRGRNRDL